jgi:hypothetical protein
MKKILKIIKRLIIGALLITGLLAGIGLVIYYLKSPNIFDRPSALTGKIETIEVYYVNWACDCADFIETKYSRNAPEYDIREEDCIFVEPENSSLKIPEKYYAKDHYYKLLRLTGQFYKNNGIPGSYEIKSEAGKPEKARVFRYNKIEMINNNE